MTVALVQSRRFEFLRNKQYHHAHGLRVSPCSLCRGCRAMLRAPDAELASKAHQPEHKQIAQCGSCEQRSVLLQTDDDAFNCCA